MSLDTVVPLGPMVTVAATQPTQSEGCRLPRQPASQRNAASALRAAKQQSIEADLEDWYTNAKTTAAKMSEDYGMPQSHFMNLMFQAGAKVIHSRKANVYNAWIHHRATEVNDGM